MSKRGDQQGMKLAKPRIAPLTEAEWTEQQRKLLQPFYQEGKTYNVLGTMAQHWDAAQKFLVWAYHVMGETSTLPPRERELLILRIGWLCQSEYEWGQHVLFARAAGLSDTEIARIKEERTQWAGRPSMPTYYAQSMSYIRTPSSAIGPGRPCRNATTQN